MRSHITIDKANGLLYILLSSFRSTVNVGNYTILLYDGGPKPSKDISLANIYNIAGRTSGLQGTWTTAGNIITSGNMQPEDRFIAYTSTIVIPEGVTFQ